MAVQKGKAAAEPSSIELRLYAKEVSAATGTDKPALQLHLVRQAMNLLTCGKNSAQPDQAVQIALDALSGINPRDELEGMLAVQMVAVHDAAMDCLRLARRRSADGLETGSLFNDATKLLQLYARQLEALDKHRGKGQQKITVEHVTVEAGGRAIVGDVHAPLPAMSNSDPRQVEQISEFSAPLSRVRDTSKRAPAASKASRNGESPSGQAAR